MSEEEVRDEVVEQEDVEQQSGESDEQVTEVTQTEQGHDFNKGLQKVQQEFSSFQRNVESKLDALTERLAEASTPRQQQEVRDEIDDLLDSENLDYDGGKVMKVLASKVRQSSDRFSQYDQTIAELNESRLEAQKEIMELRFRANNPDLDYDALLKKANDEFGRYAKGIKDPKGQRAIWNMIEEKVIGDAKAAKAAAAATSDPEPTTRAKQGTKINASPGTGKSKAQPKPRQPKPLSEWRERIFGG